MPGKISKRALDTIKKKKKVPGVMKPKVKKFKKKKIELGEKYMLTKKLKVDKKKKRV